ncbi:uncharacterized protein LOC135170781 isoform X2 [Diachasmimorpha longicaudata]|uniref:uncharacterized protein LOC135170781 isoform X2 n=1 Tax=Diachasmimorpha longicaudata TaxID=58733 RepID=UPI0030B8BFD7
MSHALKNLLFPDDAENKLSVDVVPSKWIFDSEEHKSKMCHLPVGPFTAKSISHLHKMVKNCDLVDKSWPVHRVFKNGRARDFHCHKALLLRGFQDCACIHIFIFMCFIVDTYAEACKAADKLHYDHYAFSTDRESSVERIFTEENRLSTSKKLTKKSVQEELADASFDMTSVSVHQNKENELDSRAKTSIENSASPPGKERSESPRQSDEKFGKCKRRNFNSESRSFKGKPTGKVQPSQPQTPGNSKKRSYSSSSDCSPASNEKTESSRTPMIIRNTKRCRLSPSTDIVHNSSRSTSTSPLPLLDRTSTPSHWRSHSTDRISGNSKNDPLSSSRSKKRRSRSADMSGKDTEKIKEASPGLRISQSIGEQSIEDEEETEQNYSLANVVKMLKRFHASLSSKIDRTYGKTVELTGRINEMKAQSHQPLPDAEDFDAIEPIQFPIDTKQNFTLFDTKILEDKEYRQRIVFIHVSWVKI